MRKTTEKLLALLLALVLTLSLLPTFSLAAPVAEKTESDPHMSGDVDFTLSDEPLSPASADVYQPKRDIPSSYDSRSLNIITPVKNQAYGDCWAHAAMACCETYMIKNQIPVAADGVIGSAADLSLNLSENHHAYFTYTHAYDALGMISNDYTSFGNNLFQFGGSGDLSTYSLMRWQGPANEATSALAYKTTYDNTNTPTTSTIDAQYAYSADAGIVTSVIKIPTKNRDQVKQMIMEYGAGDFTYYSSGSGCLNSTTGAYFCNQDGVINTSSYHNIDHAVTVIGWDDNYDKSNFTTTPSGNGAWIIKNSWGTNRPNGGYYYISYYDTASYNSNVFFYTVEALDTYDNNYQYDGTTNFSNTRYISAGGSFAQAFTANGAETLEAVALAAPANTPYTLKIYTGGELNVSDPTTGATLVTEQTGTLTYAGYQKIALDNPVNLAAGQRFIVLFTSNAAGTRDLPVDMVGTYSYGYGWNISWTHEAHPNSCYRCNSSWSDESASFNFRIKAYTKNARFNLTALSDDITQGTVSVSGSNILVTPAAGYGIDRVEVVSGEASFTVDGNTIHVSATEDCTLKVFFKRLDEITVTFVANGTVTTQTAYAGMPFTLPGRDDIDDGDLYAMFYGWVTERCYNVEDEPETVYYADDEFTASGDLTLYGLFWCEVTTQSTQTKTYTLVENAADVTEGVYVITWNNTYYLPNNVLKTTPSVGTGITAENNTLTNTVSDEMLWTFTGSNSSGFTVSHGTTYLSSTNAAQGITVGTNSSTTWKASVDNTYGMLLRGSDGGTRNLAVYSNTTWRYYATGTNYGSSNRLRLYKENTTGEPGGTAEYFTTDFRDNCAHSYGDWSVTSAASCTAGGVETRVCLLCGSEETRTTEPLGHAWTPGATVEPTCTDGGYTNYTCSRCGETKQDDLIEALGHDWVVDSSTEPSCTEQGATVCHCRRCDATDTQTVPALGHEFSGWTQTTAPTCTEAGTETGTCTRCGATDTRDVTALGHDWGEWTVVTAATAEAAGTERRDCARCDAYESREIAALGYDYRVLFVAACGQTAPTAMTCNSNGSITLPAGSGFTKDGVTYSFVGWVDAAVSDTTDDPTAAVLTSPYTATGNTTLYALYSYAVSSGPSADAWTKTDVSDLASTDVVAIVFTKDSKNYAITNNNGTSKGPEPVEVSVSNNKITSTVSDTLKWNIHYSSGSFTIAPNGDTTNKLYCTATNNGVRVGTNTNTAFTIDADSGYLKNTATKRYLGVYLTQDVRCYTNPDGNIANQTVAFYKFTSASQAVTHWTTEAAPHTTADPVEENRVEPTFTATGRYDSVVCCSVCGAELSRTRTEIPKLPAPDIVGHSLSTAGEVLINTYVEIPTAVQAAKQLYVSIGGGARVAVDYNAITENGYRISISCPAKDADTPVSFVFYDSQDATEPIVLEDGNAVHTYSVRDGINQYLDPANGYATSNPKAYAVAQALNDYCNYAQVHLLENPPEHSASDFQVADQIAAVTSNDLKYNENGTERTYAHSVETAGSDICYYGASVLLKKELGIHVYFKINGSINDYTATVDNQNAALIDAGSGYCYIALKNISAKNMGDWHYFTLRKTGTEESVTVRYCVYSYVYAALSKDGAATSLVNVAKALYYYGEQAKAYSDNNS